MEHHPTLAILQLKKLYFFTIKQSIKYDVGVVEIRWLDQKKENMHNNHWQKVGPFCPVETTLKVT